ncbi:MAG: AbiEi antitoxin N-terminal domain-containing protein [Thiohalorhabdaceae bacterium]
MNTNPKPKPDQQTSLANTLPEGQLVNRSWLKDRGFDRPRVDYYLRTGALEAVARGIYRKPGPPLKWEHVVYSLQQLGHDVHVGGRSALELQGMAHY